MDCSFCDVEGFRTDSTLLRENDLCLFANRDAGEGDDEGLLRGAGIIVPKAHKTTVFDLSPDEVAATFELLLVARELMDDRYRPDGYTIGWNCYRASGQAVAHAHLHVLPRFLDEPHAGKGVRWFLRQDDNRRPNPLAPGHGTRTIRTSPE